MSNQMRYPESSQEEESKMTESRPENIVNLYKKVEEEEGKPVLTPEQVKDAMKEMKKAGL